MTTSLAIGIAILVATAATYVLALRRTFRAEGVTAEHELRLSTGLPPASDPGYEDELLSRAQEFGLARARRAFFNAQIAVIWGGMMVFTLTLINALLAATHGSGQVTPVVIGATGAVPGAISASFLLESRLAQADLMSHVTAERARRREAKLIEKAFTALGIIDDVKVTAATASELALHFATAATATPAAPRRAVVPRLRRGSRSRSGATPAAGTAKTPTAKGLTAKDPTGKGRKGSARTAPAAAEAVVVLPPDSTTPGQTSAG